MPRNVNNESPIGEYNQRMRSFLEASQSLPASVSWSDAWINLPTSSEEVSASISPAETTAPSSGGTTNGAVSEGYLNAFVTGESPFGSVRIPSNTLAEGYANSFGSVDSPDPEEYFPSRPISFNMPNNSVRYVNPREGRPARSTPRARGPSPTRPPSDNRVDRETYETIIALGTEVIEVIQANVDAKLKEIKDSDSLNHDTLYRLFRDTFFDSDSSLMDNLEHLSSWNATLKQLKNGLQVYTGDQFFNKIREVASELYSSESSKYQGYPRLKKKLGKFNDVLYEKILNFYNHGAGRVICEQ